MYYTIGYASSPIPIKPDGVIEQRLNRITAGPNPASNKLIIQNGAGAIATIYSLTGKPLHTAGLKTNQESIDVNHLQPGMYILQYQYENVSRSRKIVINR